MRLGTKQQIRSFNCGSHVPSGEFLFVAGGPGWCLASPNRRSVVPMDRRFYFFPIVAVPISIGRIWQQPFQIGQPVSL